MLIKHWGYRREDLTLHLKEFLLQWEMQIENELK